MKWLTSFPLAIVLLSASVIAAFPPTPPPEALASPRELQFVFTSFNGDWSKPQKCEFQIVISEGNIRRTPTAFLGLNEMIPNTNLRIMKFEHKEKDLGTGDRSELTVMNVQTGESTVLVIGKPTEIPGAAKR